MNDVFTAERLGALGEGNIAVGHVRYGTTGVTDRVNAQPIVVNHTKGRMAIAHNGNIVNSYELRTELELQGSIFQTTSDTEVIAYNIIKERISSPSIEEADTRYKKAVTQKKNGTGKTDETGTTTSTPYDFLTEDEPLLLRAGISPELIHMVTDCVLL